MKIQTMKEIRLLVDTFYQRIREDELLAEIFESRIGDRWPEHLEKMYRFWQTMILKEQSYYGNPFAPHSSMPVNRQHFDRWTNLFIETVDDLFEGEAAEEAKKRAVFMADMFYHRIESGKNTRKRVDDKTGDPLEN